MLTFLRRTIVPFYYKHRTGIAFALMALVMLAAMPVPAHAAVDFSDITNQWASIKTFLIFLASAICAGCIIMAVIKAIGRDWGEAITFVAVAAISGYLAAHGAGWIGAETGAAI